MPSLEQQLKQIAKKLQPKIQDALEKEVFEEVRDVMQDHIQTDVYNAYTPYDPSGKGNYYHRTYTLIADATIEGKMINSNTLQVRNTRHDDDRDVAKVIETGKGYQWGYKRDLDEEIGAREFTANTREDLKNNKQHVEAFKRGLKRQNVLIE